MAAANEFGPDGCLAMGLQPTDLLHAVENGIHLGSALAADGLILTDCVHALGNGAAHLDHLVQAWLGPDVHQVLIVEDFDEADWQIPGVVEFV